MRGRNLLFSKDDLDSQLCARQLQVNRAVDGIPEQQFLISNDRDLVEHIVADLTVEPLVLREDATAMNQAETQVDVSGDPMRMFSPGHSGPFYIPGTRVDVDIPFTGQEWIFHYRTNPSFTVTSRTTFPRAEVNRGNLRISISLPQDADPEIFKEGYEHELRLIKEYVERSHNQVVGYNQSLPQLVQQAIASRRERLSKHADIAALLDIPLAAKAGAPSITPVKVEIRRPPPLPVPPKTGLAPEPGLTDETYEHILHFIRHQGRTFETTPATYAVHDEEDLRNIILAQLNGHFEGDAVGEVFRERGKTDICIEQDNRAAFIGECKLWTGPASLTSALDQLLGYLTWRDSKASLIVFNSKNRNFSKILEALPGTVRDHRLFVRDLPCEETGEWRVQMHSEEDEGRRVTVHVFVFDLYQHSGP